MNMKKILLSSMFVFNTFTTTDFVKLWQDQKTATTAEKTDVKDVSAEPTSDEVTVVKNTKNSSPLSVVEEKRQKLITFTDILLENTDIKDTYESLKDGMISFVKEVANEYISDDFTAFAGKLLANKEKGLVLINALNLGLEQSGLPTIDLGLIVEKAKNTIKDSSFCSCF